jgi:hypothetical protein
MVCMSTMPLLGSPTSSGATSKSLGAAARRCHAQARPGAPVAPCADSIDRVNSYEKKQAITGRLKNASQKC